MPGPQTINEASSFCYHEWAYNYENTQLIGLQLIAHSCKYVNNFGVLQQLKIYAFMHQERTKVCKTICCKLIFNLQLGRSLLEFMKHER